MWKNLCFSILRLIRLYLVKQLRLELYAAIDEKAVTIGNVSPPVEG